MSEKFDMKAYMKEYNQRPEVKAEKTKYSQSKIGKAKKAEYRKKPEVKAKRAKAQVKRNKRQDVKSKIAEYLQRPEVKAKRSKAQLKRSQRHIATLSDSYIAAMLKIPVHIIRQFMPNLLEAKRQELINKRLIQQQKKPKP